MPTSVLRRYTPPTCTLEIAAKDSPLSRWTDRPVLKQLRFHLSFDDPRTPEEQRVTIRGDRAQLEVLCEAVETYVQQLLNQSTDRLNLPLLERNGTGVTCVNPTVAADEQDESPLPSEQAGVYLKPKGLLAHELCLGILANPDTGNSVRLSALQLFDLANALDQYSADALSLPSLGRSPWFKSPRQWAQIAAVLVLAMGVTVPVSKFVMDVASSDLQTASTTAEVDDLDGEEPESIALSPSTLPDAEKTTLPPLLEPIPSPPEPGQLVPPSLSTVPVPQGVPVNPSARSGAAAPSAQPAPDDRVAIVPDPSNSQGASGQSAPGAGAAPTTLAIPELDQIDPSSDSAADSAADSAESSSALQSAPSARSANPSAANSTAFDTLPQVAEARSYFQERWQPPEELDQTLEYRLVLNPDGTIQQIVPLGQAAGTFVDRTGIPLIGEPFVSPLPDGRTANVRLVLSPDGRVQTFLEGGN